ncbi:hypothetical protein EZV62_020424 [Acer yangbiense]|uniref:Reverse transcriptase zinc-binding domain-containing protein n=1 Tax=Acer yangbiense TaxID=1000413 RepID=A0A5C7HEG4_9ROSI|nr:hypothetical protein EZV62_020424 [Acer yangbiense]
MLPFLLPLISQLEASSSLNSWHHFGSSRGVLPTKNLLFDRGIADSAWCPLWYGKEPPESVDHALWDCAKVRSHWESCVFYSMLLNARNMDFFDRIVWKEDMVSRFIVVSWALWVFFFVGDVDNCWDRADVDNCDNEKSTMKSVL